MASSPACSLVTGGTSTAYTVTTNENNSGGAHGICGAGTVPNNGQMTADRLAAISTAAAKRGTGRLMNSLQREWV